MSDKGLDVLFYAMALILPLSALIARRLPLAQVLKMALAWAAIFAVGVLIVAQRNRFAPAWRSARDAVFGGDRTVTGGTMRIAKNADGHFYVDATIGGVARRMLIDSGASTTALSSSTARAAGIDLESSPFPRLIDTANGIVTARTATVDRMAMGEIEVRGLPVVVSDSFGDNDVLGMNFLSRLKSWQVEGNVMILRPHTQSNLT